MAHATAPIIYPMTVPVTGSSVVFPLPDVQYSHVLLCSNVPFWFALGNSGVVVVPEALGATYVPANIPLELPTRRMLVDGITHFAVRRDGMGFSGFVNLNFELQIHEEHDILVNIHDCLMDVMKRVWGENKHDHYPHLYSEHITQEGAPHDEPTLNVGSD